MDKSLEIPVDEFDTIRERVLDQAVQGDGPIPRWNDILKNDMDYACERLVRRWEIRERLFIDTKTGELV